MDRDIANRIINQFVDASLEAYPNSNGYAYAAGYMQQVLLDLLAQVKPSQCLHVLAQFESSTKKLAEEQEA